MSDDPEVSAFVSERDEVLLSGDVDRVREFMGKNTPGLRLPPREVVEISMHKARSALVKHPEAAAASIRWLRERGYEHLGDEP